MRGERVLDLPLGFLRGMLNLIRNLLEILSIIIFPFYCNLEQLRKKGFMLETFVYWWTLGSLANWHVCLRYAATIWWFVFLCKRLGKLWMFGSLVVGYRDVNGLGVDRVECCYLYLYLNFMFLLLLLLYIRAGYLEYKWFGFIYFKFGSSYRIFNKKISS